MGNKTIMWVILVAVIVLVIGYIVLVPDSDSTTTATDGTVGGDGGNVGGGDDDNTIADDGHDDAGTDPHNHEGCAQENPGICQGLSDGTVVDSCDTCNTCTCANGGASCTEIACNDDTDGEGDATDGDDSGGDVPQLFTITMDSSGFSPSDLEINVGDIVTFEAADGSNRWPASDIHPSHTSYPGSARTKCGTSEESNIFDACKGLAEGESYPFIFNEAGSWAYHDHLAPGKGGTITVS
jgi:plastocyanin